MYAYVFHNLKDNMFEYGENSLYAIGTSNYPFISTSLVLLSLICHHRNILITLVVIQKMILPF